MNNESSLGSPLRATDWQIRREDRQAVRHKDRQPSEVPALFVVVSVAAAVAILRELSDSVPHQTIRALRVAAAGEQMDLILPLSLICNNPMLLRDAL